MVFKSEEEIRMDKNLLSVNNFLESTTSYTSSAYSAYQSRRNCLETGSLSFISSLGSMPLFM